MSGFIKNNLERWHIIQSKSELKITERELLLEEGTAGEEESEPADMGMEASD